MLTVSCREVGVDCDYVAKGETEEEIMKNAGEHAVKDHGYKQEDIMTPEMKEKNKFDNIFACPDFNKN
jgi:predicted small metal-binding protein